MNIKEVKLEIQNSIRAYHQRDEFGKYLIPVSHQRPLLLIGPPGIGKTAIMEQIADECDLGLVAYTITHHTRQSAVGLPKIVEKSYKDKTYVSTEYTMSEIVASVYECMERTGREEGILFIDEINCVSETLTPTMLQFLQKKTFGSHKIPDGYVIVAAGNPEDYNRTAKSFDIVTLDRVRMMDVEPDLDCWLEYATEKGVHGSILSYLKIRKSDFYFVEETRDEYESRSFVTARGWEDLSQLLYAYERLGLTPGKEQVKQFLQWEEAAERFATYYDLYKKYGVDYEIVNVLEGKVVSDDIFSMFEKANFEERMTVAGLLLDGIFQRVEKYDLHRLRKEALVSKLNGLCSLLSGIEKEIIENSSVAERIYRLVDEFLDRQKLALKIKQDSDIISDKEERLEFWMMDKIDQLTVEGKKKHIYDLSGILKLIDEMKNTEKIKEEDLSKAAGIAIEGACAFLGKHLGNSTEMLLFASGLLNSQKVMLYLSQYPCEAFTAMSQMILVQNV